MTGTLTGRRGVLVSGAAFATLALGEEAARAAATRMRFFWWGAQERTRRTDNAIAAYHAANPSVTILGETAPWQDYWPRLATQVAGRNAPDLIQMDYRYIVQYADRGVLMPLDQFLNGPISIADFGAPNIDCGRVHSKLYGVNLGVNAPTLLLNLTAWKAAGVPAPQGDFTWAQFAAAAEKFKQGNKRHGLYAIADFSGVEPLLENFLRQRGKALYTAGGKLAFDAADATVWFALWQDMRKRGLCVPADVQALDKADLDTNMITLGHAAASYVFSNQFVGMQALNKVDLRMNRLPRVVGAVAPGDYFKPSMFISISATSKSGEAAAKFVQFLVKSPAGVKALGVERGVPASPAARAIVEPTLKPADRAAVEFVASMDGKVGPLPPSPPKAAGAIEVELLRISQEAAFGTKSPGAAAAELVARAKALLAHG